MDVQLKKYYFSYNLRSLNMIFCSIERNWESTYHLRIEISFLHIGSCACAWMNNPHFQKSLIPKHHSVLMHQVQSCGLKEGLDTGNQQSNKIRQAKRHSFTRKEQGWNNIYIFWQKTVTRSTSLTVWEIKLRNWFPKIIFFFVWVQMSLMRCHVFRIEGSTFIKSFPFFISFPFMVSLPLIPFAFPVFILYLSWSSHMSFVPQGCCQYKTTQSYFINLKYKILDKTH